MYTQRSPYMYIQVRGREGGKRRGVRESYAALSTAIDGALSSSPRRIFFAGCWCIIRSAASSALSGRTIDDVSGRLGVLSDTDDDPPTGDERDEFDADASGGVPPLPLLRERAFVGSFT